MALFLLFLPLATAFAAGNSNSPGAIAETQSRRSAERFNIIDWIRSQQAAVRAQDAKYGRGGVLGGPYVDVTLKYMQEVGTALRDSTTLGQDTRNTGKIQFYLDDLFSQSNRGRSLNIDVGVEGFYSQTTAFAQDTPATQNIHSYKEVGGAFLIRPIGRSSQDTFLSVKAGYLGLDEQGLWSTSTTPQSLYATYLGAEAKLYLLLFLGLNGEYENMLESAANNLSGKWKMQRFRYGAFLEIYLLSLGAHLFNTEMVLTTNSGAVVKETVSGMGFSASLHF